MSAFKPLAALALIALVAGCASSVPAPVLLTLPPAATNAVAASDMPGASAPRLAVRRVTIPEYLVARRVRYRADPATLAEWPDTYWAERIEAGVSREFVAALRQHLPGLVVCQDSCGDQPAAMSLQLELVPMDYLRGARSLNARAHLALSAPGPAGRLLAARDFAYEIAADGDSAQAQAQAISTLLQRVAADAAPLVQASHP